MSILSRTRLISQIRLDLEDVIADQNATKTDAKFWTKQFLSDTNYILKGFQVTGIGLKSATVLMANATLIHPENTFDFSWFTAEDSPSNIIVPDASLQDGVKNYLELRIVEETNTPVTRAFWDPAANGGAGAEFNQEIDTVTDLLIEVVASTGGFSGNPDRIKLAIVEVDGSGNIIGILDKRDMFFRLKQDYTWASQDEVEVTLNLTAVTGTFTQGELITFSGGATAIVTQGGTVSIKANEFSSDSFSLSNGITGGSSGAIGTLDNYLEDFSGADKDIDNIKEAFDAFMTEIRAIKGTDKWFNVVNTSLSGIATHLNSQIAAEIKSSLYRWNGSDLSITEILRPEIISILARADVGGDLDGTFFITYDQNGSVGWWIDIDDSGTTIPAGALAADRNIEITTIVTNDSIGDVATKLQIAITADSEYSSALDTDTISITDNINGPRALATNGDTGFTVSRVQEGFGDITPSNADIIAKLRLLGVNNELDLTRQDGTGGSVAIPVGDQQVIFIKIPVNGLSRTYSDIGIADTNYQVINADLFEVNNENYWIAYRENDEIYIRGLGRLQNGDESSIGGGVTEDTLSYVGATSPTDSTPSYPSTEVIVQGSNLTQSIGDLDTQVKTNLDSIVSITNKSNQDRTLKLIKGGTWNWDLVTTTLSWSSNAFIQVPNLINSANLITAASNASLDADGKFLYVDINRDSPGGILTIQTGTAGSFTLTNNIVVIARRVDNNVLIGSSSFLLKDGEYLELDGALAELNRVLGQLKLNIDPLNSNRALISSSDTLLLDTNTLSQELSELLMDFDGAVINFTSGVILKADGITPLGTNFTPFIIPLNEFFWYGIGLIPAALTLDNRQLVQVQISSASTTDISALNAPFPIISGDKKLGAIQVQNNAGTIEVANIRRLGVGSGSGGASSIKTDYLDPISTILPVGVGVIIDGNAGVDGDLVLFSNLVTGNNQIYKLSGVGVALVWTAQRPFKSSSLVPFDGDTVRIRKGAAFQDQLTVFTGVSWHINDSIRMFDGVSGNFWEQSSIKLLSLANNAIADVFTVSVTGSENFIISYSLQRGTGKETGEMYLSSDGTVTSLSVSNTAINLTGTEFSSDIFGGDIRLRVTTDASGSTGDLKYFVKRWSDLTGGPTGIPNYSVSPPASTTTAAGSSTEIQFNTGGLLDADSRFAWESTGDLNLDGLRIAALSGSIVLADNQITPVTIVSYNAASYNFAIIEYSIIRDTVTRVGRLLVPTNGTTITFSDDFAETAVSGITIDVVLNGANVGVRYTSTSTGNAGVFKYSIRKWV